MPEVLLENTRTRLLEAAGEVFAELGYQGATVREICARAGVNAALVNYHFGDKLELYAEVLKFSIGAARPSVEDAPFEDALRELIARMLERMCGSERPGWHFRLMAHELASPTPAMAKVIDEAMRPVYDRLRTLIGGLLGLPPDDDETRLCAHSVIAQIVHYSNARHVIRRLWPELEMTPERLQQISRHIADFSLAYLRKTP